MKRYALAGPAALLALVAVYAQTPFDSSIKPALAPLEVPANRGAAALWQSLKKLHTRASLIMITAHPDDEDGATLAYESRGLGARVTLLTLNRGEGGANVMSSDYWDALGLVRTQELLAADRYYGVDQYWTRVCDYGFSKTMDEALTKWNHDIVLGDVVRVVRMTRPLVVTSVFVGGPSDGHGNHQVAGRVAKEVFEAAGDPKRFPEQIQEGLQPWKPLKYYARTPWFQRGGAEIKKTLDVPVGSYDPLTGETYLQLSREGLGFQKSQNGGTGIPPAGPFPSPYHRFASNVAAQEQEESFFDGIDTSLTAIGPASGFVADGLKKINAAVEEAIAQFSAAAPDKCAPALAEGYKATESLLAAVKSSNLSAAEKYDIEHELTIKLAQFNNALVEALGLSMRATVLPDHEVNPLFALFMGDPDTFRMAIPGQQFGVKISVAHESAAPVTISRIYLDSPKPDWWQIHTKKEGTGESEFEVRAAESIPFTRPYFTRPSIEQPYYDLTDPTLVNHALAPYPLSAWTEIAYQGVSLKLGQVVQTTRRETGPGVVFEPLTVGPAISAQVSPRAGIVPLSAKSFELTVNLHSNVKGAAQGTVRLDLPKGWTYDPPDQPFSTAKDGDDVALHFKVIPSALGEQHYEIGALAKLNGHEYREGYRVTGYPGLRPYFLYEPAGYQTSGVDVTVAPGLKVAYIMGSGDDVPAALEELGVNVTLLDASDLATGDLSRFDVILLGVRTYAARQDLITNNQRLLDYVKNGGAAIVQYNTPEFDHNFGPYPYKMGDEPEEVTDEESAVTILEPTNPVFTWPNKISEADFKGWIEERGSKFLTTWDSHYQALLETHDPGQAPQKGGLLFARYGKGVYIYSAYAFYRELPEGVPGAFRLMANLLSLPKNPNLLRNSPKTVAVSSAPPKGLASSSPDRRRATATFGLLRNSRKTAAVSNAPRTEIASSFAYRAQRHQTAVRFAASGRASAAFALAATSKSGDLAEAVRLARLHRFEEAQSVLDGLNAPEETAAAIAFYRVKAAVASGLHRPYDAAAEMHKALELAPTDATLQAATAAADAAAGDAYEAAGDSVKAVREYQSAMQLDPSREQYRLSLGVELMQHHTFKPATQILEKAVVDFPSSVRCETALGLAYYLEDEHDRAAAALLRAMSMDAEFSPARVYLSQISLTQTDAPAPAVADALCSFADQHPADAHANAVCGAIRLRQSDTADIRTLQRLAGAAKAAPRDALTRCEYARALAQTDALPAARTEFEACVSLDPDSVEGHFRLARVYRQLGLTALADKQAALRTAAEQRQSAANELRYKNATEFLFTLQNGAAN